MPDHVSGRPGRGTSAQRQQEFRLSLVGFTAVLGLLLIGAFLIAGRTVRTDASPAPPYWLQVNEDGFGYDATDWGTELFTFGEHLYAVNEDGLFRMEDPISKDWSQLVPPSPPAGPGPVASFKPFGNYLYAAKDHQLWWVQKGADLTATWNQVTSVGLPGGAGPVPLTMFQGQLYGLYRPGPSQPFEIWRSGDIGQAAMNWQQVVTNSFGDPANNQSVDFMGVFNDHVYAGTDTLGGIFGDPSTYGTGVEIWESPTGNPGTWTQVNIDGFGTTFPGCIGATCNFAIHQMIGSWAVYEGPNQTQEYLYVGTKSHFGAEMWRYDGSGLGGWTNVTPPGAGPCPVGCGPGRNEDMAVFQGSLYLAEGFPTAYLMKYDGVNWSIVEPGPNPLDPDNGGLLSLAVHNDRLYVSTLHEPYAGVTQGDQVWGFPFVIADSMVVEIRVDYLGHDLNPGTPEQDIVKSDNLTIALTSVELNLGPQPSDSVITFLADVPSGCEGQWVNETGTMVLFDPNFPLTQEEGLPPTPGKDVGDGNPFTAESVTSQMIPEPVGMPVAVTEVFELRCFEHSPDLVFTFCNKQELVELPDVLDPNLLNNFQCTTVVINPINLQCVETVNPHGNKVPPAGRTTLPGPKGGENEDGFYELQAIGAEDFAEIFVLDQGSGWFFGPFAHDDKIKYTEDPDATPEMKKMGSDKGQSDAIAAHIIGNGDAGLFVVYPDGTRSGVTSCLVPPPPK
jgi:hypothetical protein